jgi:hypothetical protein
LEDQPKKTSFDEDSLAGAFTKSSLADAELGDGAGTCTWRVMTPECGLDPLKYSSDNWNTNPNTPKRPARPMMDETSCVGVDFAVTCKSKMNLYLNESLI